MTRRHRKAPTTINCLSCAKLLRAIADGPSTVYEIGADTGVSYQTVRKYVKALKGEKLVYIAAWTEDTNGRRTVAAYSFGDKPDAKRSPMTRTAIVQRYRERLAHRSLSQAIAGEA